MGTWPPQFLRTTDPFIEVHVEDEESGDAGWVSAVPQERVIGSDGYDAFLRVEYEWDGETYTQDFGPNHVRGRSGLMTAMQIHRQDKEIAAGEAARRHAWRG
eukprot:NODE_6062_length_532_cov_113.442348.p2 GENE.NODE_6062_length_532_cov_113.442348~~NODE_6062_length_532_cov_113.442348.p2  ORF type:complete len:102 (-),score=29.68 NODE_6062_length_532_cov_113.442348:209-514(-)